MSLLFYDSESWKKKQQDSSFEVTMGSYDGAELCESIGVFIQSLQESTLQQDQMGYTETMDL